MPAGLPGKSRHGPVPDPTLSVMNDHEDATCTPMLCSSFAPHCCLPEGAAGLQERVHHASRPAQAKAATAQPVPDIATHARPYCNIPC